LIGRNSGISSLNPAFYFVLVDVSFLMYYKKGKEYPFTPIGMSLFPHSLSACYIFSLDFPSNKKKLITFARLLEYRQWRILSAL